MSNIQKIKLTKKFIIDNLMTINGVLNTRKFHFFTQDGINIINSKDCYIAFYNLENVPICENPGCFNITSYINFKSGFRKNCSIQCGTKNPTRQENYTKTCLDKYSVKNSLILVENSANTKQTTEKYIEDCITVHKNRFIYENTVYTNSLTKVVITCRNHGEWNIIPDAHKSGNICPKCAKIRKIRKRIKTKPTTKSKNNKFNLYCKLVDIETSKNLKYIKNINLRSYEWHLDHKYSKIQGFKDNILPYIIGSMHNLEIIHKSINCSKKGECSITKEELFRENVQTQLNF